MSGIKLDDSDMEHAVEALACMRATLESLGSVRANLSGWIDGVEAGELTISELWHRFRWVHDEMCQNLSLLKRAEDALFEQSQVLARVTA